MTKNPSPDVAPILTELLAQLEELWSHYDIILADIPASRWRSRFGSEWEYADVPRHLAYFDQDVIAAALVNGPGMPVEGQIFMHTHREFNDWNQQRIAAQRRAGAVEYALTQMRTGREAIRQALAPFDDADLGRPVWIPLTGFAGWRTVRFALEFCRQHTWMHFVQIQLRLQRTTPIASPAIVHGSLNSIVHSLMPLFDKRLPQKTPIVAVLRLTGPGGGSWTIRVADGDCLIVEGEPDQAVDLKLVMAPGTLVAILSKIQSPLLAILTGRLQVSGWSHLISFLRLFPYPQLDQTLTPVP